MSFKKSYWGYGIFMVFIIFASLMVSFAVIASRHKTELVVKDYYKEEICYQGRIEKIKNFNTLAVKPVIRFNETENCLEIKYEKTGYDGKGKINFYRPDKNDADFEIAFSNFKSIESVKDTRLVHGKWKVKLEWDESGKEYFTEHSVIIK